MAKNIDLLGNEVKTGDVMLELGRGYGCLKGSDYKYDLKLWEVPEVIDGRGNCYTIDGEQIHFYWASTKNSIKVDMGLVPEGFEYSFKHGMSDFSTKVKNGTLQELIQSSNWEDKRVKKEQVKRYEFMKTLKIETVDDLRNNIEELKKDGYVPNEIVNNVLDIAGISRTLAHNGETGIAGMCDYFQYQALIKELSNNPAYLEKPKN